MTHDRSPLEEAVSKVAAVALGFCGVLPTTLGETGGDVVR